MSDIFTAEETRALDNRVLSDLKEVCVQKLKDLEREYEDVTRVYYSAREDMLSVIEDLDSLAIAICTDPESVGRARSEIKAVRKVE